MKKIIGVTGGVGSGKTAVMEMLKDDYHAGIILSDLVGHDLMEPGAISYVQIVEEFGKGILKEDGTINREALASEVFSDAKKLARLNEISHHNIIAEVHRRIDAFQKSDVSFIALEAALLVESGIKLDFADMWFIYVDDETRIQRLMEGRGYSREKCLAIMKKQLSEEKFRQACTVVIDNSGDLSQTKKQVEVAVNALLA